MISKYKKIFVLCPPYFKTGGTELLHQLVFEINKHGGDAVITYFAANDGKYLNEAFSIYCDKYEIIDNIPDDDNNLLVIPETSTFVLKLKKYKRTKKSIYWMSVDNYFTSYPRIGYIIKNLIKKILGRNITTSIKIKNMSDDVLHFVQSKYAEDFLVKNKMNTKNIYYLSDYINQEYIANNSMIKKEDIVLFNPKKGINVTNKIITNNPNLKFVPLINMSNTEVLNACKKAKLYIDFGNHPGKDRFPREAASQNCCIITNKQGSAKYFEDVTILDEYKFENENDIMTISKQILNILENYEKHIINFDEYKKKIVGEKELFSKEVLECFFEEVK